MAKNLFELDGVQEEMDRPVENNLMIVDGLNLSFRYKHRGQSDFGADYLKTVRSLAKSYSAADTIVLSDYKGSSFRKELHPEYKGNRKEKYKNQSEEEKAQAAAFFKGFEECLELCSQVFPVIKLKGVEADDLAAYISKHPKILEKYDNVWLISTDVDWDLLMTPTVHRFSYVTRREYTLDNFYEDHGADDPIQFISSKCLQGDTGDNIFGVAGIGVKKAYNLVREYGDVLDIIDQIPLPGKQKFIAELNNSSDLLYLNLQLVDLNTFCMEAINHPDQNNINIINEVINGL